jgi:hypothetical protein
MASREKREEGVGIPKSPSRAFLPTAKFMSTRLHLLRFHYLPIMPQFDS